MPITEREDTLIREKLARRLCAVWDFALVERLGIDTDSWDQVSQARRDAWLALADLILPVLELQEIYRFPEPSGVAGMDATCEILISDWQAHVAAVKRAWGPTCDTTCDTREE
jgi:hypothetical protein